MNCDTPHTQDVVEAGQCGDCGQMWCQNCGAEITPAELRYETNGPGEPSWIEWGCCHCLKGRHVHMTAEREDMLRDAADDRRLQEAREGVEL